MPDKAIYEYAIIRVVPKVERGEFINVGVILYARTMKYLGMKYHIDHERLKAFSEHIDIEDLIEYLRAWESICNGEGEGGSIGQLEMHVRFRWLTAPRSTIIQSSKVHPGLSSDPEKVLDELHAQYVL